MILPGMGVISEIIPVFARKPLFGYWAMVVSSLAIAFAGSLVWAHHMFASGMSDMAVLVFSFLTFIVAIPSRHQGLQLGRDPLQGLDLAGAADALCPVLYLLFSIGGLAGLVLGAAATDIHVHDTHFVVGHFHYVMFGGAGFAFFAALHYWLPKIYGRMYNQRAGRRRLGASCSSASISLYYPDAGRSACRGCRAATTTTCPSFTP